MNHGGDLELVDLGLVHADEAANSYRPLGEARAVGAGAEVLEIEEPVQRADQSIARSFLLFFQLLDLEGQAPRLGSGNHI